MASDFPSTMIFFIKMIEHWLDREREQLPLWIPVGVGIGIAIWKIWGGIAIPLLAFVITLSILSAILMGWRKRLSILFIIGSVTICAGYGMIMLKSHIVAAPVLQKIWIGKFYGRIVNVENLVSRDVYRVELETGGHGNLPPKVRVNLNDRQYHADFLPGAVILLRARLTPPSPPALPGGYDFAQRAWFDGLGATGSALGDVILHEPARRTTFLPKVRDGLTRHIRNNMPGDSGAIGSALITGDRGAISRDDAEAMRNSGMAHLLAISGLHVSAVVGLVFLAVSRLLALFPWLALRIPVPIFAAATAAAVAIAYTILTGGAVPTVRSCIAALFVLVALAMGRDAMSLRLLAFGALFILLFWPESLLGPSFQFSFAAVATIITLHRSVWMQNLVSAQGRGIMNRTVRGIISLFITGLAIELILAPIAVFHFHKAGLYGALANIVAIPLTTFIIMPFEILALLFDIVGAGTPFWWVAGQAINIITLLAHRVSMFPGAVSALPSMSYWVFAAMMMGALWFAIFQTRARFLGVFMFGMGAVAMMTAPRPDILVTGDGKHMIITGNDGNYALLRPRAGSYVRNILSENAAVRGQAVPMDTWPLARCSPDTCIIGHMAGGRQWTMMATRSSYHVPYDELISACKNVDIVISDRPLPKTCSPKWLKLDRRKLRQTGGLAFYLEEGRVDIVNSGNAHLPWVAAGRP